MAQNGEDLILTVENSLIFAENQWCKISNYHPNTGSGQSIITNNGLSHVYEIIDITNNDITLEGAAAILDGDYAVVESVSDLIGGALVDMGNKEEDPTTHKIGTSNYGIGINSSDNTVNLPARAISLFETVVDETQESKITYNYQGILGTLPSMNTGVDTSVYHYMENTQGIYTNNMYIGDNSQYIAFYDDGTGKQLKIRANQILFETDDPEDPWKDVADISTEGTPGPPGDSAVQVSVHSTIGTRIVNGQGVGALYARVTKDGNQVDYVPDNIEAGTSLPSGSEGDYFIHLTGSGTSGLATLKKYHNGEWVAVTQTCTYQWTYRDKNNNLITTNTPATSGQFVYIDDTLISKKIIADVKVIVN